MAVKAAILINENWCPYRKGYVKEYICDSDGGFARLPANACPGSTCVSLESGTVKIMNTSGAWVTFGGDA